MGHGPRYVSIEVRGLAFDAESKQPVLLLQDRGRRLLLPILIGQVEAASIAARLGGPRAERPLSHDLMAQLIERLGAVVERIDIRSIEADVFHGDLCVRDARGRLHRFDCRPSDGIALALRAGARIRASAAVLESARLIEDDAPMPSLAVSADDAAGRRRLLEALAELDPERLGRYAI